MVCWSPEGTKGMHVVQRRSVRKGDGGRHDEPRRGHHLTLAAARVVEAECAERVGGDDGLEHHDLLLHQR